MGLFGGTKPVESKPSATTQPRSTGAPVPTKRSESSPASGATIVGKEASLKGELSSDADIVVEGRVDGKLRSVRQLTIGASGHVKADLHAKIVSVRGTVEGNCEASGKVEITSTGAVFGNITAPSISVAEGATFRGASKMTTNKPRSASNEKSPGQARPPRNDPRSMGSSTHNRPSR